MRSTQTMTPLKSQSEHHAGLKWITETFFLAKEDCRIGEDVQKEVFDRLRNTDAGTRDTRV